MINLPENLCVAPTTTIRQTIEAITKNSCQVALVTDPAGRLLGNPFYKAPGPLYHMLVLRGFTKTKFITNDPGTRRGEGFQYEIKTIMEAMHDWNSGDVLSGRKAALVVYPNALNP